MSAQLKSPQVLYTARVRTDGDRDGGASRSDDGRLDVRHTSPGKPGTGTNPEQLLAAGWAACFHSAMSIAAKERKVALPPGAIDAEVDLVLGEAGYSLQARFKVNLPGVPRDVAQSLVESAERSCPYSKALRDTVPTQVTLA